MNRTMYLGISFVVACCLAGCQDRSEAPKAKEAEKEAVTKQVPEEQIDALKSEDAVKEVQESEFQPVIKPRPKVSKDRKREFEKEKQAAKEKIDEILSKIEEQMSNAEMNEETQEILQKVREDAAKMLDELDKHNES